MRVDVLSHDDEIHESFPTSVSDDGCTFAGHYFVQGGGPREFWIADR